MNKQKLDITDIIVEGDLENIMYFIIELFCDGYREIDFNGYEASVEAYKINDEEHIDLSKTILRITNIINAAYFKLTKK